MSQELLVKPSKEAYRLAKVAALEEMQSERKNDSLKDCWLKLATQLQTENIPKYKISTIGKKIIIEEKRERLKKLNAPQQQIDDVTISGWWYDVMNEVGCIDSHYSHVATDAERENSSLNTNNQGMIDIFSYIKQICDIGIVKAKEMQPFEDIFGKKITREFYKQTMSIVNNCKYAFDGKTKVPTNTEQVLLQCIAAASGDLTDGGVMYMKARTKLLKQQKKDILTTKQLSRYQNGDKISDLYLLKPHSRDTAIFLDYLGIQCIRCDSWRIRKNPKPSNVECYDCGEQFIAKTAATCRFCQTPLYKEQLQHIVKTGKCDICNKENNLPEELVIYAKS